MLDVMSLSPLRGVACRLGLLLFVSPDWLPCVAAFYPAPGFRESGGRGNDTGGDLYSVGSDGYSWSSSVTTGSNGYYFSFGYGGISPNNNGYRAYGFQLRCLQE